MNGHLDPALYGFVCASVLWLALLRAAARFRGMDRTLPMKLWLGVVAVLLLFVPVAGLPLWSWAFGFCPNPSLPLLGLVCAALSERLCEIRILKPRDWQAAWQFGAVAGSLLYLYPFFFGTPDLYYWGWNHQLAVWSIAGLAVWFLCWGNRLGVLLAATLVAYEWEALESYNAWDYVVDPFYWLIGCCLSIVHATRPWRRRKTPLAEMVPSPQ